MAADSLSAIAQTVDTIRRMNVQIAQVADEQRATSQSVNQSVDAIATIAALTSDGTARVVAASADLSALARELEGGARRFTLP